LLAKGWLIDSLGEIFQWQKNLNVAEKTINAKLATAIISSRPDFSFLTILLASKDY